MPPNQTTVRTKIKRMLAEWRTGSPSLVLSFHRVGEAALDDPFRYLDTMSPGSFRTTLRLVRAVFDVVPLSELTAAPPHGRRPRMALTFDDLSRTFQTTALPILEEFQLPVTVFPCVAQTEAGFGWRDLVYYLLDRPELAAGVEPRVAEVLGAEAVRQLRTEGLYRWTKRLDLRTDWMEREVLRPAIGAHYPEFLALVARNQPYMSWTALAQVANHPLVTIGSHGARHHDYRGLSNAEIRQDVIDAHERSFRELGFHPEHFALPFGGLDQRVWQTLDQLLPDLGIKTASWCTRYANATPRSGTRLLHISRINASEAITQTLKDCVRALAQPISNYATTFSNARLAGQGEFDANVADREYQRFYALFMPQKTIHQRRDYYDYLYKNPYRDPGKPAHLGLRYDGNLEAVVSLYWAPFAVRGKPFNGPYIAGWWRLPQIHSSVGTKPFLAMARTTAPVLAGYKTSPDTRRLFERDGWSLVGLTRYEGRLSKIAKPSSYHVSESYPSEIDPLLDATNQAVSFSIWRDRRYYTYRFEGYPLMKYVYVYDGKPAHAWLAIATSDGTSLYLSDVVARPLTDEAVWRDMLAAVADYQRTTACRNLVIETNNAALMRACAAAGLTVKATFINTFLVTPELRALVGDAPFEHNTHETQACGDKLPEDKTSRGASVQSATG